MKYDPATRLLHLLVAAGVTAQMLTSLAMVTPKPGRLPNLWYEAHASVGIGLLVVVSTYWLWAAARAFVRGEGMMLFPWLSRRRRLALRDDVVRTVTELGHLSLPGGTTPRPLPAAAQGLGLLLALFLAGTGTALAVGSAPDGGMSPLLHAVKETHETAAPLMWAYLVAHPLLGVLHQLAGHRSLTHMFGFR